ncbi:MAG: ChlI component of cobalt chelatase involved in B12 biosynthesis / ChlD component of cobalt chelatase involved in B12 biosynthesis [uncultured Acidimicrobiales bacterium]|uniref:ChlI component of cobalt chelatase involved in B12 biosynthesis / ChlD component of cobalt chelatase involved in B12 biosynthesis n=1 Tax=uncultured Acidimicrobiales bacterium TaxID=310071 RepID=A0A6J4IQ53_9ACTN|nr:MAG: ChlI component of cobalt chelatase involved in B12 biosynthesis / ChlD component of cobalt chelatase involved in B12 biosynthesis [uncultured Acidimicrobiales bacterium]
MTPYPYPFLAVVGQDQAKLALLLAALEPAIGGVLLRGEKGTAKTTLARGLAGLLPGAAAFVELPVGATEDRLVGSIDITAALTGGVVKFSPGLLAAAHGGVLYVDEVNLLPDHLVDVLLDVAAAGRNRVEREGVSHTHDARFVLVGSMNPEEGELRPQLLDRFGLCVDVTSHDDPAVRTEALAARLEFDAQPEAFSTRWAKPQNRMRRRLSQVRPAPLAPGLVDQVASLCASLGAEGLRADLTICRASAALAGWEGRDEATADDVRRVAPLALAHRRRRSPLDDHGTGTDELDQALDDALGERPPADHEGDEAPVPENAGDQGGGGGGGAPRPPATPDRPERIVSLTVARHAASPPGRRTTGEGARGRLVGDRPAVEGSPGPVAVGPTARAAAASRAGTPPAPGEPLVRPQDLRAPVRQQRTGALVVLVVDASGSMGGRMAAAKGAVLSLLLDAYQRRDQVALVAVGDGGAGIVLRPTGSVEVARARLERLPTGGRTDLAAGLRLGSSLCADPAGGRAPLLVVVTDGRATAGLEGQDPVAAAEAEGALVRRRGISSVVVDVEHASGQPAARGPAGPTPLGLAVRLAEVMGARHLRLPELSAGALDATVRSALGRQAADISRSDPPEA